MGQRAAAQTAALLVVCMLLVQPQPGMARQVLPHRADSAATAPHTAALPHAGSPETTLVSTSSSASFLWRQWHTLQTSIGMLGGATLLLLQGGWQHPWEASILAMHWLRGACWSGAVMCMWLSVGYAAYPFVLAALFGVYWLVYHAGLAARICCCRRGWDAEATEAFIAAAMWLPKLPDAHQKGAGHPQEGEGQELVRRAAAYPAQPLEVISEEPDEGTSAAHDNEPAGEIQPRP